MIRQLLGSTALLGLGLLGLPADVVADADLGTAVVTISAEGAALPGALVTFHRFSDDGLPVQDFFGSGVTGADGTFTSNGLEPGEYAVELTPPQGSPYLYEWSHDAMSPFSAQRYTVSAGGVTRVSEELARGAFITGRISTDDGGTPIVWVFPHRISASGAVLGALPGATAEPDGSYRLGPLAPGRYTIEAVPPRGGYPDAWWGGAVSRDRAVAVTLRSDETRSGVDLRLSSAKAAFTGSVTALVGGAVRAVPEGSVRVLTRAGVQVADGTVSDGTVSVVDIAPGTYVVEFSFDPQRNPLDLPLTYWPGVSSIAAAQSIVVKAGSVTPLDIRLQPLPKIEASAAILPWFAEAGTVLNAAPTVTTPGVTVRYQWFQASLDQPVPDDGSPIPGATGRTLRVSALHAGSTLTAQVRLEKAGYETRILESVPATTVLDRPPGGPLPTP